MCSTLGLMPAGPKSGGSVFRLVWSKARTTDSSSRRSRSSVDIAGTPEASMGTRTAGSTW
ncbi:MAG: hypothetical protein KatS3mg103_0493 [Phycisphaerales bacterium]|nr:MAG: hypothetical protein KatS3mg103_0493 [Phycisphaerales bacterium]